ncbi:MAG: CvpA family protein [Desulfovibrio sp.]|jgi:membrane protein required for colicin V production|uniref:CvpA family protein n=1 Tax=unclassified Nitratidesulfovibrio TaxID=2802296 RepID=UPI001025BCD4|nr:CvpA family protein [Nitratidesulfovibrio sp. SRB-5]MBZ2171252.1 CvpA family protein [Nitratidesulfovibrio sp. SRB-5]MDR3045539.1 CvpA family protein [Desulfovibrio sp.]RXF77313.1 CvpA family protein [Desulfovibrio sp. DS-1]
MNFNMLDAAFLIIVGLFVLRGLFRGFVEEVAGLVGVIGGFILANRHHGDAAPHVAKVVGDPGWVNVIAYVGVFLGVLLVVAIVARIIRKLLVITFAGWLDHMAGGVMGAAKGLLICSILLAVLLHFLPDAAFVRDSRVIPYLSMITGYVKTFLPQQLF